MRRIRGPSLSATKFFLRDSKQPPINSGRELQPVSERRHIRLVLDKCSDWYPISCIDIDIVDSVVVVITVYSIRL